MMKRCILILLTLCISITSLGIMTGCAKKETNPEQSKEDLYQYSDFSDTKEQTNYVKLTVEGFGDMILELYPETAPETVKNFQKLVSEGFYDGLTFHRIIKGFMIQGGDPKGNGTGGSSATIKGEFTENGYANNLSHTRGVLSMARSSAPNSASSQFFIIHAAATYLDGKYAAFGKLVAGYTVLDNIADVKTTYGSSSEQSTPTQTVRIKSASFVKHNK